MSVLATDTFTRADAVTLGANWALPQGVGSWLGVFSNQVETEGPSGQRAGGQYTAVTVPNDQYSQIVVVTNPSGAGGPFARGITSGGARNRYQAGQASAEFGGAITVSRVWKEIANVNTSLGTGSTSLAAGQTWYLEVQGTTLIMKINGGTEITVTDAALASGQFGIYAEAAASGVGLYDTWEGGDFAAGGGASPQRMTMGVGV